MLAYPETQKKAQQEIDEVVGTERLPSFDDYEKLPYIRAMVGSFFYHPASVVSRRYRSKNYCDGDP